MLIKAALVAVVVAVAAAVFKDGSDLVARQPLSVDDATVQRAAGFALEELQQLSDSGVYETLTLEAIQSAAFQEGVFHNNIFLDVVLASPFIKSPTRTSTHEVIVMENKEDGVLSFAIDEFPVMEDDAIEAFWIRKVERHKLMREETFAELEAEAAKEAL